MYCIKCGKNSQSSELLCENCKINSGFGEVQEDQVEKSRTYGMYLAMLGNILLLLGMLCSFILIKTDAPTDYVAEIFKEKTTGPVETEATETPDDGGEEETEEEEVQMEAKGYSFSIVEYISRRTPDEKNEEDIAILQQVVTKMNNAGETSLNLDDAEQVEKVLGSTDSSETQQILETLEYYNGYNVSGIITIVLGIGALAAAFWMLYRKDFRWSIVFSLIATAPVWNLFVKLNGVTAWEFRYGMYAFVIGIFAVIIGVIVGGNADVCPECKTTLPGGAVYCAKCSVELKQKKEKSNKVVPLISKHSMIIATVGNIIMFLPVILPTFSVKADGKTKYMSIMGLRGLQNVADKDMTNILFLVLIAGLVLLIGAVVTSIFEKCIVSMGCSLAACATMLVAIFLVQDIVELKALFTIVLIPIGLAVALVAGLNAPIDFQVKKKKVKNDNKDSDAELKES